MPHVIYVFLSRDAYPTIVVSTGALENLLIITKRQFRYHSALTLLNFSFSLRASDNLISSKSEKREKLFPNAKNSMIRFLRNRCRLNALIR